MKLTYHNLTIHGSLCFPGVNQIIFECPKCGPPYEISIYARLNDKNPKEPIWSWSCTKLDLSDFTVEPSINNHYHGRKICGWHGHIINGEAIGT